MPKLIYHANFLESYHRISNYGYAIFGEKSADKFDKTLRSIVKILKVFPLSFRQENSLRGLNVEYRSVVLLRNWKIVYRYEEERDDVHLIDIWDNRSNPDVLWKNFKE